MAKPRKSVSMTLALTRDDDRPVVMGTLQDMVADEGCSLRGDDIVWAQAVDLDGRPGYRITYAKTTGAKQLHKRIVAEVERRLAEARAEMALAPNEVQAEMDKAVPAPTCAYAGPPVVAVALVRTGPGYSLRVLELPPAIANDYTAHEGEPDVLSIGLDTARSILKGGAQ